MARATRAGSLSLTGTAYYSDVSNDIYLFPSPTAVAGSTIEGYFGNIPKTRRVGIEIAGRYAFGEAHSVYANYAYTRATFQSEAEIFSVLEDIGIENTTEPGDLIPLVPLQQLKAGVNLRFDFGLRAGADLRWIGEQVYQQDEANNMPKLPSYFVADLRAGWEFGKWEISGVVNNLFSTTYATFGTFNFNQGAPGSPARAVPHAGVCHAVPRDRDPCLRRRSRLIRGQGGAAGGPRGGPPGPGGREKALTEGAPGPHIASGRPCDPVPLERPSCPLESRRA